MQLAASRSGGWCSGPGPQGWAAQPTREVGCLSVCWRLQQGKSMSSMRARLVVMGLHQSRKGSNQRGRSFLYVGCLAIVEHSPQQCMLHSAGADAGAATLNADRFATPYPGHNKQAPLYRVSTQGSSDTLPCRSCSTQQQLPSSQHAVVYSVDTLANKRNHTTA